jgi:hypothetical protein
MKQVMACIMTIRGITTIVIDQNAYDREMKTHQHGDQGKNMKFD